MWLALIAAVLLALWFGLKAWISSAMLIDNFSDRSPAPWLIACGICVVGALVLFGGIIFR